MKTLTTREILRFPVTMSLAPLLMAREDMDVLVSRTGLSPSSSSTSSVTSGTAASSQFEGSSQLSDVEFAKKEGRISVQSDTSGLNEAQLALRKDFGTK